MKKIKLHKQEELIEKYEKTLEEQKNNYETKLSAKDATIKVLTDIITQNKTEYQTPTNSTAPMEHRNEESP